MKKSLTVEIFILDNDTNTVSKIFECDGFFISSILTSHFSLDTSVKDIHYDITKEQILTLQSELSKLRSNVIGRKNTPQLCRYVNLLDTTQKAVDKLIDNISKLSNGKLLYQARYM